MMNELNTHVDLNILPLGSNDFLMGMDWLENHNVILHYHNKSFICMDYNGNTIKVKGIPRKVTIKEISTL